ncbi:succinate dehydrogenase subunit 6, mitochondrial [Impatiens glandulifera]|uniref:succinate dehydrogenase subunit 6, mitochondrial n=1 Tax=Impatiens glandulifera TaxID=253017 RepID=UPI001FB0C4C9|nr:succinate dehydrogenase subunit 6, mitochondrial [Impatiens glandulifera]
MADTADSVQSFFKKHWKGYKEFWGERFSILDNYSRYLETDPSWSEADIQEFIASDPVHGPTLKTCRDTAKIAAVGSVVGAFSTAAFSWKYSRSPHGAALSFGAGAVFGWTFGQEIASHWYQLYRKDPMAAQVKFLEWWDLKRQ